MSDPEEEGGDAAAADAGDTATTVEGSDAAAAPQDAASKGKGKGGETEGFVPKKQQLFLVEFLIDTVNIDAEGFCDELMEGQTCVTLKFLSFPPMVVCEKDFDPGREHGVDRVQFNSGKSLMFAFSEKQCEDPPPMMAELVVSKKCPEGSPTEKVDIGRIKVCMVQLFQQVYEVAKFTPDKLPASRSIKDCFMLIGRGKRTTGEVGVYIRLTCLGQNVVTEFQCGSDMKQDPILFKNREGKRVYQFTGTDAKADECAEEAVAKSREGCGCLGPAPPRTCSGGGQGDAGRAPPAGRRSVLGGAYAKGGRVVLDIPDKANRCRGGRTEEKQRPPAKVGDLRPAKVESPKAKDGVTVSQVAADPEQNCFVLKVGDKGQIPDRGKMILEFRTPKQKILPKVLPPYHEDIAIQTDAPKKGKGKGKGRKK